jgi:hypothetical protein
VLAATPLPAALLLFAGGHSAVGRLARRKKRRNAGRQIQPAATPNHGGLSLIVRYSRSRLHISGGVQA